SIAHALRDLGRDQEAAARAAAVRPQAAELTRLVRDLSQRQAQKAAKVAQRLSADAADRERKLWVFVVALVIAGFFLSRYTVQSVHGPLGRLVTAAERFGAGDLRPVTTGQMPREFRVLADAIQQMGNRLRQIVGDVIGESDRIAGAAGDLCAGSQARAASPCVASPAVVAILAGAAQPRAAESARAAEEVARMAGSSREQMEDVTATMTAGQAKVRGIESVAEGAAHGLAESATAIELVEQAAARVRVTAQANRETTTQLQGQAEQVAIRATAHAAGAEQATAAAEQQGAATE